jgi:hypothetical protein
MKKFIKEFAADVKNRLSAYLTVAFFTILWTALFYALIIYPVLTSNPCDIY